MFGSGAIERTLNLLVAENTDLRQTLRSERDAWAAERKVLLDRILALTSPQATTLLQPQPPRPAAAVTGPRRLNLPGYVNAPPLPPYPERTAEKAS